LIGFKSKKHNPIVPASNHDEQRIAPKPPTAWSMMVSRLQRLGESRR